ncbi:hypothetical protein NSS70_05940 [Aeribacillus sp. FSL K6-2848]|uniref:Uncharacterized protein n=1 Tax=Saccharococcus caldoxylosilyticus TaxID=81408 RepID=A0A150LX57_9BACL|nr:hypothetical protein B4119_0551 [Parageobacillus caldoxylosilyticus]
MDADTFGFRWNAYVRKQYKEAIELAKRHQKEKKKEIIVSVEQGQERNEETVENKLIWRDVIVFYNPTDRMHSIIR